MWGTGSKPSRYDTADDSGSANPKQPQQGHTNAESPGGACNKRQVGDQVVKPPAKMFKVGFAQEGSDNDRGNGARSGRSHCGGGGTFGTRFEGQNPALMTREGRLQN
ncbi:hypothetical protein PHYPSEUDO_008727 [Phytophthora pseudosyringae]|uniref:Uncharacterized protein n=1 Tax=Phytophthora pseudosyringae TaxID=221518 RepID=A0A8T1VEE9_9STRA|nr:hypothetical protein PHYPSEUDO_008727 [Phytophthora pseudosyringae]